MFRNLWSEWLILARHIGNFNARALITIVYFSLILPFGVLSRLLSDPLAVKTSATSRGWRARETTDVNLERARRQG
ncbi:MAG: hypothetical protein GY759_18515 [Chloroflexi bacterium]|nr:hypothetical protein [Chloroflexota bacterium]